MQSSEDLAGVTLAGESRTLPGVPGTLLEAKYLSKTDQILVLYLHQDGDVYLGTMDPHSGAVLSKARVHDSVVGQDRFSYSTATGKVRCPALPPIPDEATALCSKYAKLWPHTYDAAPLGGCGSAYLLWCPR